jgi:hypothetical protein
MKAMETLENSPQAQKIAKGDHHGASPIYNHKLRGENESFWDAMDQGRAARSKECSVMIAAMLKKTDDTR